MEVISLSKIKIKATLKSTKENYIFTGSAIKKQKIIIYNDNDIKTKITIDDIITIERKHDYILKINLKEGINLEGKYMNKYGSLKVETYTRNIEISKFNLKATYDLIINDEYIDTFEYNLEYSIDS